MRIAANINIFALILFFLCSFFIVNKQYSSNTVKNFSFSKNNYDQAKYSSFSNEQYSFESEDLDDDKVDDLKKDREFVIIGFLLIASLILFKNFFQYFAWRNIIDFYAGEASFLRVLRI